MTASVRLDPSPDLAVRLEALGLHPDAFPSPEGEAAWTLALHDGRLALCPCPNSGSMPTVRPLAVTFSEGAMGFRLARASHEMVVKAVRGRKRQIHTVIDATAGLGQDAFLLAAAGLEVTMIEANPWVHALLADGLHRLRQASEFEELASRLSLRFGRAEPLLQTLTADAVTLDPMFPPRRGHAKTGRPMQIFHAVVGPASDEAALLAAARGAARHKVVVKRPRKAPALPGPPPASTLELKSSRFDIYPV